MKIGPRRSSRRFLGPWIGLCLSATASPTLALSLEDPPALREAQALLNRVDAGRGRAPQAPVRVAGPGKRVEAGPRTPPPDLQDRQLATVLKNCGKPCEGFLKDLLRLGDERALFESSLRPGMPAANPEQRAFLGEMRRFIPSLDPDTVFFVPESHPFHQSCCEAFVLPFADRSGREQKLAFLQDAVEPSFPMALHLVHEHMHQLQVSRFRLQRLLEQATGVPAKHLDMAASFLMEGNAQHMARQHLGVILTAENDPFSARMRAWLRAEAAKSGRKPSGPTASIAGTEGDWDKAALLHDLEELSVRDGPFAQRVEEQREFPNVPSSAAPGVSIAMSGNLRPLLEAWTPSKQEAVRLLRDRIAAYERSPDISNYLKLQMREAVTRAILPSSPFGAKQAAELLNDHDDYLARTGLRLNRPAGR